MKRYLVFLLLLFAIVSCKSKQEITDGMLAFKLKKYELAKTLLAKEIPQAKESEKLKKILALADSYNFSNDAKNAAFWYEKGIENGGNANLYLNIAMMQKREENFEAAIENIEKYRRLSFDELKAKSETAICKKAIEEKSKPNTLSINNMSTINSAQSDYGLSLYKNGQYVLTSSRSEATGTANHPWNGEKNSDIFIWNKSTDKLTRLDSIVNTFAPEGSIHFTKDFKIGFFTRCEYSEDANKNGYCAIYKIEKDGESWYAPEKLNFFGDTVNCGQAFVSADGKRLYFSSDAKSGYGGRDVYFADINQNNIGVPINAGYTVNTANDELFPTVDSKGNLYFSSTGRTGYGGLDIFMVKPEKRGFGDAFHLPFPINSGADDFALIYEKEFDEKNTNGIVELGYFSSNRKGGKGSDDIYVFQKELFNTFALELYVQEKKYENPNDDQSNFLGLVALDSAEILLTKENILNNNTVLSDEKGMQYFDLKAETDYKITVSKKDYFTQSITVSTKYLKDIANINILLRDTVVLEKIYPEKEIVIDNIYYDLDKANLRDESFPVLDKLISFFEENNQLIIEIGSHTDSRGSDAYNIDLSQRRAQSVVDYFIQKGIPKSQLVAKGYGETKLLNTCGNDVNCSEEEHQKNRRTSFKVISEKGILQSE